MVLRAPHHRLRVTCPLRAERTASRWPAHDSSSPEAVLGERSPSTSWGSRLAGRDLLGPVAGHAVAGGDPVDLDDPQLGPVGVALRGLLPRAAGVEAAAGRRVRGRGQVAREQDLLALVLDHRVRDRDRGHQRARVGVQRRRVELAGLRLLDQPAEVHHADPVADVAHHREVVGDDEVGEPELVLQLLEQVEHLRLHRDVERGDRLVGHDQLRVDRQRPGDADPLPLAAGELVGVLRQRDRRQADRGQQLTEPRARLLLVVGQAVRLHALDEQRLHRLAGVQARHRVLEDHLEVLPLAPQLLALEAWRCRRRRRRPTPRSASPG